MEHNSLEPREIRSRNINFSVINIHWYLRYGTGKIILEENLGRKRQGTNGQKWESFSTKKSVKGGKVIKETSKELPGKQMKEKNNNNNSNNQMLCCCETIKCYIVADLEEIF